MFPFFFSSFHCICASYYISLLLEPSHTHPPTYLSYPPIVYGSASQRACTPQTARFPRRYGCTSSASSSSSDSASQTRTRTLPEFPKFPTTYFSDSLRFRVSPSLPASHLLSLSSPPPLVTRPLNLPSVRRISVPLCAHRRRTTTSLLGLRCSCYARVWGCRWRLERSCGRL